MPTASRPVPCPCGSREPYAECCGPLHLGRGAGGPTAPTAERLMRSRFSAFVLGDAPYLLASWHPSTRPAALDLSDEVEWRRLEITGKTAGGEDDTDGTVAFTASYWDVEGAHLGEQREDSAFLRHSGQWFYVGPVDGT